MGLAYIRGMNGTTTMEGANMTKHIVNEKEARAGSLCVGCFHHKETGTLVCWKCFKAPINGLKYSGLSFEQWQATF